MKQILTKFSSLFEDEGWLPKGEFESVDFRSLEGTRCYCDPAAEQIITERFAEYPLNAIHWIDGGDFHYLSALWLRHLKNPARLVLLDNHPDNQPPALSPDILSCGSWMLEAARNPMVQEKAKAIYLSLDLDILSPDYFRTNWDQGQMSLQELLDTISAIMEGKEIAGIDICGGITLEQGASAEDFAINRKTRSILEDYFSSLK